MSHKRRDAYAREQRRQRAQDAETKKQECLTQIREDEAGRLCDMCKEPRDTCEERNSVSFDHLYSPMSAEQQFQEEHFVGHNPDSCPMKPVVCQMTSGISSAS